MVKDQAPTQGQSSSAGFDASGEKSASIWEMVQAVQNSTAPWEDITAPRAALDAPSWPEPGGLA